MRWLGHIMALRRSIVVLSIVVVAWTVSGVTERLASGGAPAAGGGGTSLIGKLEGPVVVTDPAQFPKSFKEAPQLTELVKAGKLPPAAERIGQDPLVLKPVHSVGKYGGTWRRGFTGPADFWNGYRCCSGPDTLLFWDYTGDTPVPYIAKGWELQDGGRTLIVHLRRGMKWSDGHPFTADDFLFWYEDMYSNKELVPLPSSVMMINGKPGELSKVDAYTVMFKFPEPYYMLPDVLAGSTPSAAKHTRGSMVWGGMRRHIT
jgi:peptide/nickel transport system substrate-binding protein